MLEITREEKRTSSGGEKPVVTVSDMKRMHPHCQDTNPGYNTLRTRFVSAKHAKEIMKKNSLKMRQGFFSGAEAEMARRAISEFLSDNKLDLSDLNRYFLEDSIFPMADLVRHVVEQLPYRTFKSVHLHIAFCYHPGVHDKFTEEQNIQLLSYVRQHGYQWTIIGRVVEKYRDHCRRQYLSLTGQTERRLVDREIKRIVSDGVPVTEEEWLEVCQLYNITKKSLSKGLSKYMKRIEFNRDDTYYTDIVLMSYILAYNHYCALQVDIPALLCFLNEQPAAALLAEGADGFGDGPENIPDGAPSEQDAKHVSTGAHTRGSPLYQSVQRGVARCLCVPDKFNLGVPVEYDDIFWFNICEMIPLALPVARSKYFSICRIYGLRTFEDILKTLRELCYGFLVDRIKKGFLEGLRADRPREEEESESG